LCSAAAYACHKGGGDCPPDQRAAHELPASWQEVGGQGVLVRVHRELPVGIGREEGVL